MANTTTFYSDNCNTASWQNNSVIYNTATWTTTGTNTIIPGTYVGGGGGVTIYPNTPTYSTKTVYRMISWKDMSPELKSELVAWRLDGNQALFGLELDIEFDGVMQHCRAYTDSPEGLMVLFDVPTTVDQTSTTWMAYTGGNNDTTWSNYTMTW